MTETTEQALRGIFQTPRTDDEVLTIMAIAFEDKISSIVDKAIAILETLRETNANAFDVMLLHGIIVTHARRLFRDTVPRDLGTEANRVCAAIETIADRAALAINIAINTDDDALMDILREH
jgi:hypothetical protein